MCILRAVATTAAVAAGGCGGVFVPFLAIGDLGGRVFAPGLGIGNDLAGGVNKGYKFTLTGTQGGYVINANPVNFGADGNRTFFSDQSMVIRQNFGQEPATATSAEMKN